MMIVFAVIGIAAKVYTFPLNDLTFSAEINGVKASPSGSDQFHKEFTSENQQRHESYAPLDHQRLDYFRPSISGPGEDYRPTGSGPMKDSKLLSLRAGGDFRLLGSKSKRNSRPENPQGVSQDPRPSFLRPGEDYTPQGSRPSSSFDLQDLSSGVSHSPGSQPVGISKSQFLRLGENSRLQNLRRDDETRPGSKSNEYPKPNSSIPNEYSEPEDTKPDQVYKPFSFLPEFIAFGSSENSESSKQNSNEIASSRTKENPSQTTAQTSPAVGEEAPTVESTTKIPRRDPTYRTVYTVPNGCACAYTRQYKPVCGTDGQTYGNIGILQCAKTCGSDVKEFLDGSCGWNNGHPGTISLNYG